MSTTVTIRLYSGKPNPTWELSEQQAAKLASLLTAEKEATLNASSASIGLLGYTGFEIRSTADGNLPAKALVFDGIIALDSLDALNFIDAESEVEKFLLETAEGELDDEEKEYVRQELSTNVAKGVAGLASGITPLVVPPYNPGKWNNNASVQRNNNCYNYANDKITNTFAQPGRGSGTVGPNPPTCSGTGSAAQRDGQVPVGAASSTPSHGHYIALVVWPGRDYHWYRLDSNAMWSHKPGQTAARNTDQSGNRISNPQTCNRGPYTSWCGYYHCIPSRTRIR